MEANDWGVANLDPRDLIGRIYVGVGWALNIAAY